MNLNMTSFRIIYPYSNNCPTVVTRVEQEDGQFAEVKLDQPASVRDTFKVAMIPTFVVNPPYIQYINGVRTTWNTWKNENDEEDERASDLAAEMRYAFKDAVPGRVFKVMLEQVTFMLRILDSAFPKDKTKVGTIWRLKKECLGNLPGMTGVAYETYGDPDNPSMSLIFPNGRYDGFSPEDMEIFLEPEQVGFCEEVADYAFTTVTRVCKDFEAKRFSTAWKNDSEEQLATED